MSDDVVLRPMRWWDIEQAALVDAELFGRDAWSVETFWAELGRPETRAYVVAEADGDLVGYAGVMCVGPTADVQTIAVARSAWGAGTGRALLDVLVDVAHGRGAHELLLEVRADNERAVDLYRRRGFERVALRRGYYENENGDAVIMRLRPLDEEPASD